jgi:hypothetical protein
VREKCLVVSLFLIRHFAQMPDSTTDLADLIQPELVGTDIPKRGSE